MFLLYYTGKLPTSFTHCFDLFIGSSSVVLDVRENPGRVGTDTNTNNGAKYSFFLQRRKY